MTTVTEYYLKLKNGYHDVEGCPDCQHYINCNWQVLHLCRRMNQWRQHWEAVFAANNLASFDADSEAKK